MNEQEQAAGERQVQELLISPLLALGLTKPGGLRKSAFEDMLKGLRQKLAYMSADGLRDLFEWCAGHPGGRERDRFPIALKILNQARLIEAPEEGPSPLVLKVFSHDVGQRALERGYAPELLRYLRGARKWPTEWALTQIKQDADDPIRWLEDTEMRLARGEDLPKERLEARDRRRAELRKCEEIADQATANAAKFAGAGR